MKYVKLVGNQKYIKIIKAEANKSNPYSIISKAALDNALERLKPNSFKLWAYLAANSNGYEFAFKSSFFLELTGMSRNTYTAAWKDLIDNGFIEEGVILRGSIEGFLFWEGGSEQRESIKN